MGQILFTKQACVVGGYLGGAYSWAADVRLSSLALECISPSAAMILELEIGGVLTGQQLVVPPNSVGTSRLRTSLGSRVIPANTECRWKVASGTGTLALELSLSVQWSWAKALAAASDQTSRFWVRWQNAPEVLDVWTYDSTSQQFTEIVAGITTGRCSVVNTTDFSLSIRGTPVLWVASGKLNCHQLLENVEPLILLPRLEFWMRSADGVQNRLGYVGFGGELYCPNIFERVMAAATTRYTLRGGGVAKAVWGAEGLLAQDLVEA